MTPSLSLRLGSNHNTMSPAAPTHALTNKLPFLWCGGGTDTSGWGLPSTRTSGGFCNRYRSWGGSLIKQNSPHLCPVSIHYGAKIQSRSWNCIVLFVAKSLTRNHFISQEIPLRSMVLMFQTEKKWSIVANQSPLDWSKVRMCKSAENRNGPTYWSGVGICGLARQDYL